MFEIEGSLYRHHIRLVAWVLESSMLTWQNHSYRFVLPCNSLLVSSNKTVLWTCLKKVILWVLSSDTKPFYFCFFFLTSTLQMSFWFRSYHMTNYDCIGRGESERLLQITMQIQRSSVHDEKPGCIHWSDVFQLVWLYRLLQSLANDNYEECHWINTLAFSSFECCLFLGYSGPCAVYFFGFTVSKIWIGGGAFGTLWGRVWLFFFCGSDAVASA